MSKAEAQTDEWVGNNSVNWADPNWSGSHNPPVSGDALTFDLAGSSGTTLTDNLTTPGAFTVAGITFNADASAFTINPAAGTNGFTLGAAGITNNGTNIETVNDAVNLAANATTTFTTTAGGGNILLGGNVTNTGNASLTSAGTGNLTLSGPTNSFANVVQNSTGTLTLGGTIAQSGNVDAYAGAVNFASGSTTSGQLVSVFTHNNAIVNVSGAATFYYTGINSSDSGASSFNVLNGGNYTSNGGLTIGGAGSLNVSGTGTFTTHGGVTLNNNANISITGPKALVSLQSVNNSTSTSTISINGGTFQTTGFVYSGNFNSAINVGANGATLDAAGGAGTQFAFYGGSISGNGPVSFIDSATAGTTNSAQTWLITGNSAGLTGNVSIGTGQSNSGWVQYRSLNSNPFGTGTVTINGGGMLTNDGSNGWTLANSLVLNGGMLGTQSTSGTYSGPITLNAGTTSTLGWANNQSAPFSISGVISGSGNLSQATPSGGTNTITLTNANTFTGSYTEVNGALNLSNSLALQNSTLTSGGNGVVFNSSVASNAFTLGGLSGGANMTLQNSAGAAIALSVGNNNSNQLYSAVLSGAGSLNKVGTGTQTLTGGNTFTGGTTITAGALQLGNGGTTGSLSTTGAVVDNGTLVFDRSNGVSQGTDFSGGALTGAGGLVQNGAGTVSLGNSGNSFTGNIVVNSGILQGGSGTGSNSGTSVFGATGAANAGRTITANAGGTISLTTNNVFGGGGVSQANLPTIVLNSGTLTSSRYNAIGNINLNSGATITGNISDGNPYNGYQFIGTVAVGGTSASTINNSGQDFLLGNGTTTFNVAKTGGPGPDLNVITPLANGSGDYNGTAALTKTGAGTMQVSGANTYGGGTTVTGGTLLFANTTGSATGTGALKVAAGAGIGGVGASSGASFAVGGAGSLVQANVQVGNGTDATSDLGLVGAASSSFTNTRLAFNLNTATSQSNELQVGKTLLGFNPNTGGTGTNLLSLNLLGTSSIASGTSYTLLAGTNFGSGGVDNSQYSGFTTDGSGADGLLAGQYKITGGDLTLGFTSSAAFTEYGPDALVYLDTTQGVDNIDVKFTIPTEVPEPRTWALMVGGLALLFWVQRRRNA